MALLRKSLNIFGRVDQWQKISNFSSLKMPIASFLHTVEPSSRFNKAIVSASFQQQQNDKYEPLLFSRTTVITPQILPCLPRSRNTALDLPPLTLISDLQMPTVEAHLNNAHIMPENVKMEDPTPIFKIIKQAHRMLVIRKKKMRKHQRKKFLKKNRIIYARILQARAAVKEKNLQLKLISVLNEGRNFSPRKFAFDLLTAAYEKVELPPKLPRKKPWEF